MRGSSWWILGTGLLIFGLTEGWAEMINESARDIPVAYDVDVVVVGGTTGAVAAAVEAAQEGAKVFLAAPRPYLGEDICATLRLWLEPGEEPVSPLAKAVFTPPRPALSIEKALPFTYRADPPSASAREDNVSRIPPMPMQAKRALDEALLKAGVQFLYGCYATDVLWSADGKPVGILMANRSGRQAVKAKIIIDATSHASVARMAGAKFREAASGPREFRRVVVGGQPVEPPGARVRKLPSPMQIEQGGGTEQAYRDAYEYTLSLPMRDASFASYAEAEQQARDLTWNPGQLLSSDMLFEIPPDSICSSLPPEVSRGLARSLTAGSKGELSSLDAFKPAGIERLYVLSGCADVSREEAARLLRPLALMDAGARIGKAAGDAARRLPKLNPYDPGGRGCEGMTNLKVPPRPSKSGQVWELLAGVRSTREELPKVYLDDTNVAVLGTYDVVVVGGGTGGAPAGIAAARQGAKTLVIEYLDGLGGVGTLGLIGTYYHGYRGGFTKEIDEGVAAMGGSPQPVNASWNIEHKMEWYRRELRKAGADIWFGALACGSLRWYNRVTGVVVATPDGRGVLLAKVVIDATGNADIAAAAGAECMTTGAAHVAVQGTGMPPRKPGEHYTNTDYTITDDADVMDAWRTYVAGRNKYKDAFDLSPIIDSRERRRIIGDFVISPLDIWNQRTYPDTIGLSKSNFDTHGFTIHSLFALQAPDHKEVSAYTPYRALLPQGIEGILVTGLGLSAHRDAMPILRMQPDIQNQGYAAGIAAAMAAKTGVGLRQIDIKALQQQLVEKGNLPASVLSDHDSYPLSAESIQAAVANVVPDYAGVAILLAQPEEALPLLRRALENSEKDDAKLVYAHILGIMADPTGAEILAKAVANMPWDAGWSFTGMGQFGGSLSRVDSLLVALARTHDARALDIILGKAAALTPDSEFSHFRAVAIALETLAWPEAAQTLASLLSKPGMTGNAVADIDAAKKAAETPNPNLERDHSIRELILARALFRCGDYQGLGEKILKTYENDLRGHLAQHAHAVLDGAAQPGGTKPSKRNAYEDLDLETAR